MIQVQINKQAVFQEILLKVVVLATKQTNLGPTVITRLGYI